MQGVFVEGHRPKTKKELKEAVASGGRVSLERTSMLGDEYNGPVTAMPEGVSVAIVGPDPYNSRKWYATVLRKGNVIQIK